MPNKKHTEPIYYLSVEGNQETDSSVDVEVTTCTHQISSAETIRWTTTRWAKPVENRAWRAHVQQQQKKKRREEIAAKRETKEAGKKSKHQTYKQPFFSS